MPLKSDRLLLYRKIEHAVNRKIRLYRNLPDTRPRDWRGRTITTFPDPSTVGLRGRQIQYLRIEVLPRIAASLLLHVSDLQDDSGLDASSQHTSATNKDIQEPIRCITLLISNLVLLSKGNYDARVRNVIKAACCQVLEEVYLQNDQTTAESRPSRALHFLTTKFSTEKKKKTQADEPLLEEEEWLWKTKNSSLTLPLLPQQLAKDRFEFLEKLICCDILKIIFEKMQREEQQQSQSNPNRKRTKAKQILIRGLQITTVSLVVGGLFAFTGGLAAPGFVAALSAFGVASVIPVTLTTTAALASMFGAVGGGLAAYKMKRRTDGLSEWRIRKEYSTTSTEQEEQKVMLRGLHATVCVSGWLQSRQDFQTPFGIQANDPASTDKLELLQRFYSVHAPDRIPLCKRLIKAFKGSEEELWEKLKEKYGSDPDSLLPFDKSYDPRLLENLILEEVDDLLKSQVLDERHAKEMEEIFEANIMLVKMEYMNAEMFAEMDMETLEAMHNDDDEDAIDLTDHDDDEVVRINIDMEETHQVTNLEEEATDMPVGVATNQSDAVVASNQEQQCEKGDNWSLESGGSSEHKSWSDCEVGFPRQHSVRNEETIAPVNVNPLSHDTANELKEEESSQAETDSFRSSLGPEGREQFVSEEASPVAATMENHVLDLEGFIVDESMQSHQSSVLGEERVALESNVDNVACEAKLPLDETSDKSNESSDSESEKEKTSERDHSHIVWDWEAHYSGELYTVTWETEFLMKLCRVVEVLFYEIGNQVSRQVLQQTIIGGMVSAVAIPSALTTATGVIDDPYQLCSFRSEKAGIELAHCLLESDEGRPVSLVGFSFGARVIFSCLLELVRHQARWEQQQRPKDTKKPEEEQQQQEVERKKLPKWMSKMKMKSKKNDSDSETFQYDREPASLIEDVVLIGLPRLVDIKEWIAARELVGGRLINCYNKNDWILSYMINLRCWKGVSKTCGTHPILNIEGVENYEVSHLASSHGRYPLAVPYILHHVSYGTPCPPPQ
jgi:hypothetical protein